MIVIRVLMNVKPQDRAVFASMMHEDIIESRKFEGCVRFDLFSDPADPNAFLLYEEWDSLAAFDAYRHSDYLKERGAQIFPLLSQPPQSAYYEAAVLSA